MHDFRDVVSQAAMCTMQVTLLDWHDKQQPITSHMNRTKEED